MSDDGFFLRMCVWAAFVAVLGIVDLLWRSRVRRVGGDWGKARGAQQGATVYTDREDGRAFPESPWLGTKEATSSALKPERQGGVCADKTGPVGPPAAGPVSFDGRAA